MIRQEGWVIKCNLLKFRFKRRHHQPNRWRLKSFDCQICLISYFYSRSVFLDVSTNGLVQGKLVSE